VADYLVEVGANRIERFLTALANPPLGSARAQYEGYLKRFPEFFPAGLQNNMYPVQRVENFSEALRSIWTEPDIRARQWKIFVLRLTYRTGIEPDKAAQLYLVPALTPFEQAMVYLDRNHKRFRYCQNPEGCRLTPYYIAKSLKPTKFCSTECANPARRESKSKWWDVNKGKGGKKRATKKA
jgi:hypothetical protein